MGRIQTSSRALMGAALLTGLYGCGGSDQPASSSGAPANYGAGGCDALSWLGTWTWYAHPDDRLGVTSDCTAKDTYCGQTLKFPATTDNSGNLSIWFGTNNGASGCLDSGTKDCSVSYDSVDSILKITCGGAIMRFHR